METSYVTVLPWWLRFYLLEIKSKLLSGPPNRTEVLHASVRRGWWC
jgi:hypothetical protein